MMGYAAYGHLVLFTNMAYYVHEETLLAIFRPF